MKIPYQNLMPRVIFLIRNALQWIKTLIYRISSKICSPRQLSILKRGSIHSTYSSNCNQQHLVLQNQSRSIEARDHRRRPHSLCRSNITIITSGKAGKCFIEESGVSKRTSSSGIGSLTSTDLQFNVFFVDFNNINIMNKKQTLGYP